MVEGSPKKHPPTACLWIAWLSLALGMPYALGFAEPYGMVSRAGAYGFAALGILAGFWLASFPHVQFALEAHGPLRKTLWVCGGCTVALLCFAEFVHLGDLLHVLAQKTGHTAWPSLPSFTLSNAPFATAVWNLYAALAPIEGLLAFASSLLCIICGRASGIVCTPSGTDGPVPLRPHARRLATALAFLAGTCRMYAWSLLLPRSSYPIAVPDLFFAESELWVAQTPFLLVIAPGALALVGGWCLRRNAPLLSVALISACAGEVLAHAAARLWVQILALPLWLALAALTLHLVTAVVLVLLARHESVLAAAPDGNTTPQRTAAGEPARIDPSGSTGQASLHEHLQHAIDSSTALQLEEQGLTQGELNVARAAVLGLSSTGAAELLDIQPSTVRAYRARICAKLGLDSVNELTAFLSSRQDASAEEACTTPNVPKAPSSPRAGDGGSDVHPASARGSLLATTGALGCLALAVLPVRSLYTSWNMVWIVSFGVAAGLVLTAALQTRPSASRPLPALLGLVGSMAVVAYAHVSPAATGVLLGSWFGRAVVVAATAATVAFALELVRAAHPAHVPASQRALCAGAGACILAGACAGRGAWLAACLVCAILAALGTARIPQSAIPRTARARTANAQTAEASGPTPISAFLVAACLGFAWEESWRGQTYASLQTPCIAFLVLLAAYQAWLIANGHSKKHPAIGHVLIAAGTVCLGFALGPCYALLTLVACLALSLQAQPSDGPTSPWRSLYIACAVGIGAGVYGGNVHGSKLLLHPFEARGVYEDAVWWTLGLALLAVATLYIAGQLSLSRTQHFANTFATPGHLRRIEGYLISKGLSQPEVDLVLLLANGATMSQAARQLNYSSSAAYRLKQAAFARLGVHNQAQLPEHLAIALAE